MAEYDSKVERQKADYESAIKQAKNSLAAKNADKVLNSRNNYLDELSKSLDEAGQPPQEKLIFQKESANQSVLRKFNKLFE
jgi:hypothetical protein